MLYLGDTVLVGFIMLYLGDTVLVGFIMLYLGDKVLVGFIMLYLGDAALVGFIMLLASLTETQFWWVYHTVLRIHSSCGFYHAAVAAFLFVLKFHKQKKILFWFITAQ